LKVLEYQERTVEQFTDFLTILATKRESSEKLAKLARDNGMEVPLLDWGEEAWKEFSRLGKLPKAKDATGTSYVPSWLKRIDGTGNAVPSVCLKLPTGAGKTYLATRCVEQLHRIFYRRATGLVLWVVPSEAIYTQTWKSLANREHPYRMTLERASGGRVKMLRRGDAFNKADVENYLCVMVLQMASAARQETDILKMFRDSGRYPGFFPEEDDFEAQKELLSLVPNLETLDLAEGAFGGGPCIKGSLGNVLCLTRPTIILDEGHTAYTPTRRETLAKFNPQFILELSATPNSRGNHQSNVLMAVSGGELKKEQMLKLPLNLHNLGEGTWKDTLVSAHGKLEELQKLAELEQQETGRYVRPILLIRVERTGRDQTDAGKVHSDDVRRFLHERLGAKEGEVAEKSSSTDELTSHNLMDEQCPVRFIITKDALREGWDCPFAYVLAVLDATTAGTALTQMVGRILRQPNAQLFAPERGELNESQVFVFRQNVADAVANVQEGLSKEGMGDLGPLIRASGGASSGSGSSSIVEVNRRPAIRRKIFLPRILTREGEGWRLFDYQGDLYPRVPWAELIWTKSSTFSPDDETALAHTRVAVDVDQLGKDPREPRQPLGTTVSGEKPSLDFASLVRLLMDVIPNPWEAARILRIALKELRERGITENQILASRFRLIETLNRDLLEEVHKHTEKIFCDLLSSGEISFRLEGKGLNWELAEKLFIPVTTPPDQPITFKGNGKPVEKSLFEPVWSSEFNGLEKDVALYLDDADAVHWWHRIAVNADWYLDGWRKKKVFPDFLISLEDKGSHQRLLVLETKGLHLKNDDTEYKQKLFEVLEKHCTGGVPVGELKLEDKTGQMSFRLVFDGDWKSQVDNAMTPPSLDAKIETIEV
jgi:type III restriction enzyme